MLCSMSGGSMLLILRQAHQDGMPGMYTALPICTLEEECACNPQLRRYANILPAASYRQYTYACGHAIWRTCTRVRQVLVHNGMFITVAAWGSFWVQAIHTVSEHQKQYVEHTNTHTHTHTHTNRHTQTDAHTHTQPQTGHMCRPGPGSVSR